MLALRERIMNGLKDAMRNKQERETATLRMIIAKMRERDIEARPAGNMTGIGEAEILTMLESMIKQRRESITLYQKGGRADLAQQESEEIAVIEGFLPQKLSPEEVDAAIAEAITAIGAKDIKDMGKVMGALKGQYAGRMDFSQAGARIKERLSQAS